MKIKLLIAPLAALLLAACAHTDISVAGPNGKPMRIAHFEGDMIMESFSYQSGNGQSLTFTCNSVMHSTATQAQGQAADTVLGGVATAGTGIGTGVALSGMLPGGLGALVQKIK